MPVLQLMTHDGHKAYRMFCPGCKCTHMITVEGPNAWGFDGDMKSPTFTPSLKTWGSDWLCHSFIKKGQWQFLNDSTHELAGKVADMEEVDGMVWRPEHEPE